MAPVLQTETVRGKRGRGANGKTTVFGIFEREIQVCAAIVPNCKAKTLRAITQGKVGAASIINSDGWRGYNSLIDLGYGHFRVDHSKDEIARGKVHINGIVSFWGSLPGRRLQANAEKRLR